MAITQHSFREVRADVNIRLVSFKEAREIMDHLEAQWREKFPDSTPDNLIIRAQSEGEFPITLTFTINASEYI